MKENTIDLEEYKRLLDIKKKLDNKEITTNELSLEDIETLNKLYMNEIKQLTTDIKELQEENKRLKVLKGIE